jgi:type I restriction-modification system DNA methylase subunit
LKTPLAVKAPSPPPKTPTKSFEETLWDTANKLRGAMSTNAKGEGEIRQKLVENNCVDCMNALPGQLFITAQISVCLWFLTKNKKADSEHDYMPTEERYVGAQNLLCDLSYLNRRRLSTNSTRIITSTKLAA